MAAVVVAVAANDTVQSHPSTDPTAEGENPKLLAGAASLLGADKPTSSTNDSEHHPIWREKARQAYIVVNRRRSRYRACRRRFLLLTAYQYSVHGSRKSAPPHVI